MINTRSWRRSLALLIGLAAMSAGAMAQEGMRVEPTRVHPVRVHARLSIQHIAHTPAPHHAGASITLEVLVKNDGNFKSSGREELHYKCESTQAHGPNCPMPDGKRLLPAIEPGQSYSAHYLTSPDWKAGTYEFSAWIAVPGSHERADVHTATLDVLPTGRPTPPGESMPSTLRKPGAETELNPQPEPPSKATLPAVQLPAVQLPAVQIPTEFRHLQPLPPLKRLRESPGVMRLQPSERVAAVGDVDTTKVNLKLAKPDLVFTIGVYGGGTIYPVGVEAINQGRLMSKPSSFRMTCDEYTGKSKTGKCLSTINVKVPALQPGNGAILSLPYAKALVCDPQNTGVSVCIVTTKIDVNNENIESNEDNNTQVFAVHPG